MGIEFFCKGSESMKSLLGFIAFIISSVIRIIPFLIFLMLHLFWSVYTYQLDPLKLLDVRLIPTLFGDFMWIYIALGVIIFVFLTLEFPFLAWGVFIGGIIGQNLFFLRQWENIIYKLGKPTLLYRWFFFIYAGLLIGFILQCIFTGGRKVIKISRYNRLRRMNNRTAGTELKNQA